MNRTCFVEGDRVLVDGWRIGWVTGMTIDGKILIRDCEDIYCAEGFTYVDYKRVTLYNEGELGLRYGE